ncbi:hypothetical protein Syun_014294 [Stephania yunnanensis]|uniref:Prenylcysteine lyase domain-containing protein n=1 Tax=Stephania yunnanensis TaxID=152371 RepID=A0AAP0P9E6_9MAGN
MTKPSFLLLILFFFINKSDSSTHQICIIGSGIAGSSLAHFLRKYSPQSTTTSHQSILIFERNDVIGGRMRTVSIGGDAFEAGASIIHPKNQYALEFTKSLNLSVRAPSSGADSLAIWDGTRFLFQTFSPKSDSPILDKIYDLFNSLLLLRRYGFSLIRMERFVERMLKCFLKFYEGFEERPVFGTVEEMLKWAGLYEYTARTLEEELVDAGLSPLLISELVTVITRVNYGQSVSISGLAGAVSLAGSGGGLWSVEGGNCQIPARLIQSSDVTLNLQEEITSISRLGNSYQLNSTKGNSYSCDVAVIATPLDEVNITFSPPISIPERKLQHTHATFVRGLLDPGYFGLNSVADIPELIATVEIPDLPFTCISILKKYSDDDMTYKIFSRAPLQDALLDRLFSSRKETIRINWGAYPHFKAPEVFAPFLLDGFHLYYVNAFENAASAIETGAVAAENVARLILSRYPGLNSRDSSILTSFAHDGDLLHLDL